MRYTVLPGIPQDLSHICLGTGSYGSDISPSDSFRLLDRFAELGGTFLDTAHVYGAWAPSGYNGGYGNSEKVIGEWLEKTGMREKIAVGTKGAHPDLDTGVPRMNAQDIDRHIADSLDRLKTSSIDMYWIHTDEPSIPTGEILGMLAEHVAAGRLRAIGCSNWSVQRQKEAAEASIALGLPSFVASQVGWSFARATESCHRAHVLMLFMDSDMHQHHVETGLAAAGYSGQGCGFFAKKYDGLDFASADFPSPGLVTRYGNDLSYRRREAAVELAREKGCNANQVALAWMIHQPFPAFPIAAPHSLEQMVDTMKAGEIELTAEELEKLTCGQNG